MSTLNQKTYIDDSFILSPTAIGVVIVSYLIFVYQIGPRYMKNRPPYKLDTFMRVYNLFQVLICLFITNRIFDITSWNIFDFTKCTHYYPNTPEREAFDSITFIIFLLKIFELTDTILFVLRKKQNQVTYLHVFHHSSTITLCYLILKYYKGIGALFPVYLNSYIHVIMYTYYFFANICSAETMKKYIFLKKSITIMQMVQFCIILIHACLMWNTCKMPSVIKIYYCFVVSVIFYGFYDFYKKAYLSGREKKLKNSTK